MIVVFTVSMISMIVVMVFFVLMINIFVIMVVIMVFVLVYLEFPQDLMVLLDLKVVSSVQSFAPKQIN